MYRYKILENISYILKDVVGFKFIVFREYNFRGQYLVLGHWYAGINKRINLISCSKKYNYDIKM